MSVTVHSDTADRKATLCAILAELDSYVLADQVADHLQTAGIKGEPGACGDCPISRFVRQRWQQLTDQDVCVMTDSVGVYVYTVPAADRAVLLAMVDTPSVVASFLRCFDAHAYPDLIA